MPTTDEALSQWPNYRTCFVWLVHWSTYRFRSPADLDQQLLPFPGREDELESNKRANREYEEARRFVFEKFDFVYGEIYHLLDEVGTAMPIYLVDLLMAAWSAAHDLEKQHQSHEAPTGLGAVIVETVCELLELIEREICNDSGSVGWYSASYYNQINPKFGPRLRQAVKRKHIWSKTRDLANGDTEKVYRWDDVMMRWPHDLAGVVPPHIATRNTLPLNLSSD